MWVVVRGEAGIGKSTVLDALLDIVPEGVLVHRGAAHELQQDVPYALIADLFGLRPHSPDPRRTALGRRLSGDDGAPADSFEPHAMVLGVTEGIVDLLVEEAAEQASLVVVDDLQWADRSSLQVLDRLLRRASEIGLRAVLATRPTDRADVQVLDRAGWIGGNQIELGPLADDEALQVVAEVVRAQPGPNLTALVHGAAGNPLYLAELGRAAVDGGTLLAAGESVDLPGPGAPSSFQDAVRQRLGSLPEPTVATLQASSILGTSIDVGIVGGLIGSDAMAVMEALGPARVSGLVIQREGSLQFRHELVREALYQGVPATARRLLHRAAASALTDPGAVAVHLEAAGPPYSRADLDLLRGAAEKALPVDGRRSLELLELVLENTAPDAVDRVDLCADRARALVMSGDLEGAADALAALEHAGSRTHIAVGRAMLEAQGARDQPDPDLVASLQAQAEEITDEAARLDVLGVVAYHAARADPTRFRGILTGLPEDGPHLPLDARIHFRLARAMHHYKDGDLFAAVELARGAYRLARESSSNPLPAVRAGLALGVFGGDLEPFRAEATAALQDATRRAEESHQAGMVPVAHALLANAYWAGGDWDEAEAAYRACAQAAEEAEVPRWRAEGLFMLSAIAADRGQTETAREHFQESESVGWQRGAEGGAGRGWMRPAALEARIAFGAGLDRDAIAAWTADLHDPETVPFGKAISAMDLCVASLFAGDREGVVVAADCLRALEGYGPPIGMVRPLVLAALDGDVEAAGAVADEARITPVYGFAKMAEVAGLVARDAGDRETAVRWLREVLDAWERCGALALHGRTAAALRSLGVHTRGRIGERASTGWGSLTDAEARVVREVATGLLYKEVAGRLHLSRRTVETHVASALRKLDLRNRNELAAGYFKREA